MLMFAARMAVPAFAGIVYVAVPDPVPDPVSVIHDPVVDDVHAHVADVVTVMVPVPPAGVMTMRTGDTAKVHAALGCVTTKLRPAIVSVALRADDVVLAAALKPAEPEPVPLPPEIVTHDAPLVAVQPHPLDVVTATVPPPPAADIAMFAGEIV